MEMFDLFKGHNEEKKGPNEKVDLSGLLGDTKLIESKDTFPYSGIPSEFLLEKDSRFSPYSIREENIVHFLEKRGGVLKNIEYFLKKRDDLLEKKDIALHTIHRALYLATKYAVKGKDEKSKEELPILVADELNKLKSVYVYLKQIINNKEIINDTSSTAISLNNYLKEENIVIRKPKYFPDTNLGDIITMNVNGVLVQLYSHKVGGIADRGGYLRI